MPKQCRKTYQGSHDSHIGTRSIQGKLATLSGTKQPSCSLAGCPKLILSRGQFDFKPRVNETLSIDVREGASGASADAPGVGLEMVSDLKLLQKDENK